ncbi:hypothetical protein MSG28_006095 [Choristoneura fumiferana]|uniref:Uncharacterized protein n=1 Tax=Choristoneura fumiferana TaxID=7141 RepID=A0ACC0JDM2_CHOFU|nr:hypothetical protein MSG28_006095 [Choristoneura fumiferana]
MPNMLTSCGSFMSTVQPTCGAGQRGAARLESQAHVRAADEHRTGRCRAWRWCCARVAAGRSHRSHTAVTVQVQQRGVHQQAQVVVIGRAPGARSWGRHT